MPIDPREAAWNDSIISDFHAHRGQITGGPLAGSRLLLLTTTGARSGQSHIAPLGYTLDGERYVVVGSNSGRPQNPEWLRNIEADPMVTVEVGDTTFQALATVTSGAQRRGLLDAHIAAIPIFGRYEEMAGRALPVVTLARQE
jgi:deazaflavin-dependent oxidoreductase (nitroreductase family)